MMESPDVMRAVTPDRSVPRPLPRVVIREDAAGTWVHIRPPYDAQRQDVVAWLRATFPRHGDRQWHDERSAWRVSRPALLRQWVDALARAGVVVYWPAEDQRLGRARPSWS